MSRSPAPPLSSIGPRADTFFFFFLGRERLFPLENYSRLEHRLSPLILSGLTTLPIQFSRRAWRSPIRSARAGRGARIFSPEDPPPRSLLRPLSSSSLATFLVLPTLHSLQPCGWPHYAIAAHKDAKVKSYSDSQLIYAVGSRSHPMSRLLLHTGLLRTTGLSVQHDLHHLDSRLRRSRLRTYPIPTLLIDGAIRRQGFSDAIMSEYLHYSSLKVRNSGLTAFVIPKSQISFQPRSQPTPNP